MAVMQIKGMEEYTKKIKDLAKNEEKVIKTSVYVGAGVIADAVRQHSRHYPWRKAGTDSRLLEHRNVRYQGYPGSRRETL